MRAVVPCLPSGWWRHVFTVGQPVKKCAVSPAGRRHLRVRGGRDHRRLRDDGHRRRHDRHAALRVPPLQERLERAREDDARPTPALPYRPPPRPLWRAARRATARRNGGGERRRRRRWRGPASRGEPRTLPSCFPVGARRSTPRYFPPPSPSLFALLLPSTPHTPLRLARGARVRVMVVESPDSSAGVQVAVLVNGRVRG